MEKVVALVSGGLDSSTVMAMLNEKNVEIYAISFSYGQNNAIELQRIKQFIKNYNVKSHRVINIDLSAFTTTSLINQEIEVPKYQAATDLGNEVPTTYVPARNTIFLSYAVGYAEVVGAKSIYIGAHESDSANYPDCRPEYIESFQKMANLATKIGTEGDGIKIYAPLINMSKSEVLATGLALNVDYSSTISCYDPNEQGQSCGKCHACLVRLKAFADNGLSDVIEYVK